MLLIRSGKMPHRCGAREYEIVHRGAIYKGAGSELGSAMLAFCEKTEGDKPNRIWLTLSSAEARELGEQLVKLADQAEGK